VLDELGDAACADCAASAEPAWPSLGRAVAASSSWDAALERWEPAVAEAAAAVDARELPPPPDA
jgi:hypothetical protein